MTSAQFFKVFVYGTLKRGEPNHNLLANVENGFAKFLGEGKTAKKFPLVIGTRYNIPFLINLPGTGDQVKGEVFSVDEKMLARLDVLEDYPEFYDREVKEIDMESGEVKENCWVYILKNYPAKLLKLPFLTDYRDTPEKAYQSRCQRVSNILAKDDLEYNQE